MKKKIALDIRYAENPNTGLSRFTVNIFHNLIKHTNSKEFSFLVFLPPKNLSNYLDHLFKEEKFKLKKIYSSKKRGLKWKFPFFIFDLRIYRLLKKEKVTIFISPYIDPPYLPGIKVISTIHDLIFINVKDYFNDLRIVKRFFAELRIIITLIYSDHIISVSEATKTLLIKRYSWLPNIKNKLENINVINNGVTKFNSCSDGQKSFFFNRKYLLYVGDRRNHKNLFYTINLVKRLNQKFNEGFLLVIAGSKSFKNPKLQSYINNNLFVQEIVDPTDDILDRLYNNCTALILLSKDEGFGIPVIEAASRSKKIVVSNIAALREVAPENSLLLDLKSKNDHINNLHNYLNKSSKVDSKKVLKNWSWELSSLKLKKLIFSLLNNNSNQ